MKVALCRSAAVGVVAALVVAGGVLAAVPAAAASSSRLSGTDRYGTSAAIAGQFAAASTVWVATGADYPDALSAAPAAAKQGAPLLLTAPASLPAAVKAQVARLKPTRIVVAGGTGAVSTAVLNQLKSASPKASVVRVAGGDRYATSRAIVNYAFGAAPVAYAVAGTDWADSLSAGAAAAHAKGPLLLVNGGAKAADAATLSTLASHKVTSLRIAGGTGVVTSAVQSSLAKKVSSVTRASGADRYATSVAVNRSAFAPTAAKAVLASGANFPDALSGVALAGHLGAPLYLVEPSCIPSPTDADLVRLGATSRVLLGGTAALSSAVGSGALCADWYTKTYGTFAPKTVSGTGDGVIALPSGVKGGLIQATFTGSNGAGSWFDVIVQDKNSIQIDTALSSFGAAFSGTSGWGLAQPVSGSAASSLQVRATGSWQIRLYPVADAQPLPSSGSGYGVYRFTGGSGAWKITGKTAQSARLFDVRQYAAGPRFQVLVGSSSAAYSGTVNHLAGPSVIQVLGNGAWSIR